MANNNIEDFASAPGETLLDTITELGMSQVELAERTGLDKKTINQIIKGAEPVSHKTALALEKVLRVPARFWIKLESNYREHLARIEEQRTLDSFADWARTFPYAEMAKKGFITATRKAEDKAKFLLSYFGVASPAQWRYCYYEMELGLSYRKTASVAKDKLPGLSAWLRRGEQLANQTPTQPYSTENFKQALEEIRNLTTEPAQVFQPKMEQLCADAGVIYHLVPEISGQGVSGVMRWFHKRPMIQQTLLFKTNDQFWFTFFHEAKHVLQNRKGTIFLEGEQASHEDQQREKEANDFASNILIPKAAWTTFIHSKDFSNATINNFAKELSIHPGIVSGRLLREKHIHYGSPQAKLRAKLTWS